MRAPFVHGVKSIKTRTLGAQSHADIDILVDPDYVDRAISYHLEQNVEYTDVKQLPSGTEVEVFDVSLLKRIWEIADDRRGTEYLTTYISDSRDQFKVASMPVEALAMK